MRSWQRRTAGALIVVVGLAFIVSVIANSLFSVGPAFEGLADGFRPVLRTEPIAALQQDLDGLQAVSGEFSDRAVPMLSQSLGMSPEAFVGFMQESFPDVAAGIDQVPEITEEFRGVVATLEAEQERFASADAIPTTSLPATTVPWTLAIAGVLAVGIGLWLVFRPARWAAVAAVVLGALLAAVPLVLRLPAKASDADQMNENLKPVYTAELIQGADQGLATVGAMGTQILEEMLPALAQQLGMDEAGLQAFLQENLPAMSAAIETMPDAMERFTRVVETFRSHLDDYDTISSVSFVPIVWTMIVGGIVALVAGAWALLASRPRQEQQADLVPPRRLDTVA